MISHLEDTNLDLSRRAIYLYQLLANKEGPTLKEAVLNSFDQFNTTLLCDDLKNYLDTEFGINIDNVGDLEKNGHIISN